MTTYAEWHRANPDGDLPQYELWVKRGHEPAWNVGARFLAQVSDDTRPCIDLAGALVFAYVKDGVLVVSVDLDTAHPGAFDVYGDDRCVPVRVNVGDTTVFEAGP